MPRHTPPTETDPHPVLVVEHLACRLGGAKILHDVSLTVAKGEFISVVGPNGAGKTTLLKCLNRIVAATAGDIEICGKPLARYSQMELASRVAYVPQAEGRHFDFTVFEFVVLARYPHLSPFSSISQTDERIVRDALATTGMSAFAQRVHGTLSGGERQKVFIAAALAQQANLLLLDEPTTFLDPHHQQEILTILRQINHDEGRTIVSVTHDLNGAMLVSDRIVAMKDGRTTFSGTPEETMTPAALEHIYGGAFRFASHPRTGQAMLVPEVGSDVA